MKETRKRWWVRVLGVLLALVGLALLGATWVFIDGYRTYSTHEERILSEIQRLSGLLATGVDPGIPKTKAGDLVEAPPLGGTAEPSRILDQNGRVIGEFAPASSRFIRRVSDLPAFAIPALLAVEDRDFMNHPGYSIKGIFRAMVVNAIHFEMRQGGSTLTQQLAKILFTTRSRTLGRKSFEWFCARELEARFSKEQILLLYLNLAYFGHGNYGIASASWSYFGKAPQAMNLVECAHLIGLLSGPGLYSPRVNPQKSQWRHRVALDMIADAGLADPLWVQREHQKYWRDGNGTTVSKATALWPMSVNRAPHFVEWIRRDLEKSFPEDTVPKGGYQVHTTLDLDLQAAAETSLAQGLVAINGAIPAASNRIEGALIAIDPKNGAVLAAVGGSRFSIDNQLLRFEQSRRPIGSLAKPFTYLLAMDRLEYAPSRLLDDSPMTVRIPGRVWEPKNYDRLNLAPMPLERALVMSRNLPALRTLDAVGIGNYVKLVSAAAGVEKDRIPRNLSSGLGSFDLSPVEVATLYALIPRGGRPLQTEKITVVEGPDREPALDHREFFTAQESRSESLVSADATERLLDMLKKVFSSAEGTAHGAILATGFGGREIGGKTGTTQGYRDAWFAGFTADFVAVVWLGVDHNVELENGGGGRWAAPIWLSFVSRSGSGKGPRRLEVLGSRGKAGEAIPRAEREPEAEPGTTTNQTPVSNEML